MRAIIILLISTYNDMNVQSDQRQESSTVAKGPDQLKRLKSNLGG